VTLGGPVPAVNKKLAAGAIYNHGAAVIDRKGRYSLRIEILAYPTCIRRPRKGGSRRNIAMPFGVEKLGCMHIIYKKSIVNLCYRL